MAPSSANVAIQGVGAAPDFSGWPEPSTLVPVAINWTQGGSVVEVEGSFDNWRGQVNVRMPAAFAWGWGRRGRFRGRGRGRGWGWGRGRGRGVLCNPCFMS